MRDQTQQNNQSKPPDANKFDITKCDRIESGLSQDEIEQIESAFQKYHDTVELYEKLIRIEDDPQRRDVLKKLLVAFSEDNK